MDDFAKLDKMFSDMLRDIPEKKAELMDKVGDLLQEQVISNIESRVGTSGGGKKEKLIAGVRKVVGSGGGYTAINPDYSKGSNIHHLIENGHRIVRNGVVVGFVNGKHNYRNALTQSESKIIKLAENMIDEVLGDG